MRLPVGYWIACLIAGVCCLPIVYWNARHEWVTIRHVGWQAGVEQREGWRWLGPLAFVGGQMAVLMGAWFVAWAAAVWRYRPWQHAEPDAPARESFPRWRVGLSTRYLWWLSVPTFAVFLTASVKTSGQINWAVAAYMSGGVLVAAWLAEQLASPRRAWRRAVVLSGATAVVAGIAVTLVVHYPVLGRPLFVALAGPPTPDRPQPLRRVDPTCRLRGWRTLAAEVDRVRAELRAEGEEPVVAASVWNLPGVLGVYGEGHPQVHSIGLTAGDRRSQYDFWRPNPLWDPAAFRGRTFVLVGQLGSDVLEAFDVVETPRSVVYSEGDQPVAAWYVTVARGYRGFGPVERFLQSARH